MEYAKFAQQYRLPVDKTVTKDDNCIDCSDHVPSNDNLARLNEYYQKNRKEPIEVTYSKTGPDHIPLFVCEATYESLTYKATAQTKKEAEKKVKSFIYENCITKPPPQRVQPKTPTQPQAQVQVQIQKPTPIYVSRVESDTIVGDYENFRELLRKDPAENIKTFKPILIIDLASIDIDAISSPETEELCKKKFSRVIMYTNKSYFEWKNAVVLTTIEDDTGTNHESINRITYFLLDNNFEKDICILTLNKYPLLTNVASKTNQKVTATRDLQSFI